MEEFVCVHRADGSELTVLWINSFQVSLVFQIIFPRGAFQKCPSLGSLLNLRVAIGFSRSGFLRLVEFEQTWGKGPVFFPMTKNALAAKLFRPDLDWQLARFLPHTPHLGGSLQSRKHLIN
jgi:hypothetical protein